MANNAPGYQKNGAVWASDKEEEVTRFCGIIRKFLVDELLQLWSVIRGKMSFVGLRPECPVFVEQLVKVIPYNSRRRVIKHGITSWAQICYP